MRGKEDNSNGSTNSTLSAAFNTSIDKLGLIDLPLLDRLLTWSNHYSTPTLAHLDHVLYNVPMSLAFPNSSLSSLPKPTSDHMPIQLHMTTTIPKANLFQI